MIGSLRGRLVHRGAAEIAVEVGGIGYRVLVSPATAAGLGEVGEEVFLWVHHHQREDAQALYGFDSRDERSCFEALLGAHGVGPALALAVLSVHSPATLARAVAEDDLPALCLVPGVGRKTAARLLIDLKSALSAPVAPEPPNSAAPGGLAALASEGGAGAARADVRAALLELGYSDAEARAALSDLPQQGAPGALLRDALSRLAVRR